MATNITANNAFTIRRVATYNLRLFSTQNMHLSTNENTNLDKYLMNNQNLKTSRSLYFQFIYNFSH